MGGGHSHKGKPKQKATDLIPFSDIPELRGPIDIERNIFIRPASLGITPMWYRFVCCSGNWEWTPYVSLDNWIPVQTMTVLGGSWAGKKPANANKCIIDYLNESQPIPPHFLEHLKVDSALLNCEISQALSDMELKSPFKYIQNNLRMMEEQKLQCTFFYNEQHPMLAVFKDLPQFNDDSVLRIDLIFVINTETDIKENIVRFQSKSFGDFKYDERIDYDLTNTQVLKRELFQVQAFCIEYQKLNSKYSKNWNNCRKFMMELCSFIDVPFVDGTACEELWYKARNATTNNNSS